jgi:hypothetical protein
LDALGYAAGMTKTRELAKALAEACPFDDGRIYKIDDVERILAVFGAVLAKRLAEGNDDAIDIPGVCTISRTARGAAKSPLVEGTIPAGWTVRAALKKRFKQDVKRLAPPPDIE